MIQPRIIRKRDAPAYCGMDKSLFDKHIRHLIELEICAGSKFVAYDIHDLNAAIDTFKRSHSKVWEKKTRNTTCQKEHPVYSSTKKINNGASINESKVLEDSGSAYDRELSKKLK